MRISKPVMLGFGSPAERSILCGLEGLAGVMIAWQIGDGPHLEGCMVTLAIARPSCRAAQQSRFNDERSLQQQLAAPNASSQ